MPRQFYFIKIVNSRKFVDVKIYHDLQKRCLICLNSNRMYMYFEYTQPYVHTFLIDTLNCQIMGFLENVPLFVPNSRLNEMGKFLNYEK